MTGMRLMSVGVLALLFGSGCADGTRIAGTKAPPSAISASVDLQPVVFHGEEVMSHSVVNTLYNWDVGDAGPVVFASRPMGPARWPTNNAPQADTYIHVVVYPIGSTVTGLMCYDTPNENCPDHGPQVAAGAMAGFPAVYGGGVLGHDHLEAPHATPAHAWVMFVLFTSKAAANTHLTTLTQIQNAVTSGDAFYVPERGLTFDNAPVNGMLYQMATPWICPAYSYCPPPQ